MQKESAIAIICLRKVRSMGLQFLFGVSRTSDSNSARYVSMHDCAYVRERRFAVAGRPPRDADMNGMRCYYRRVPTDNSLRRDFAERRGVRKEGECFSMQEQKVVTAEESRSRKAA